MQTGPSAADEEPGQGAAAPPSVVAKITLLFAQPLDAAQRLMIDRVQTLIQVHTFEVHDFQASGETVQRIRVVDHVSEIALLYEAADRLVTRFTVHSKQDRDVLVWTSSLFFQYIHYHVARIATVNDVPHHMDWEAQQDPQAPERIKRWVESGRSLIERLHRTER